MIYRTPGSYVRFIKNVKPKNTVETARIMGLIGTGTDFYEVYNEVVTKGTGICDELAHGYVDSIYSVSLKPMLTAKSTIGNTVYTQGTNYDLAIGSDGKSYIVWNALESSAPSVNITNDNIDDTAFTTFMGKITLPSIDPNKGFLVKDAVYKLTISTVGTTVVLSLKNTNTSDPSTMISADGQNIAEFADMGINFSLTTDALAGLVKDNSFFITTKAAVTQKPASIAVDETADNNTNFVSLIGPTLKVIDQTAVKTGSYEIVINNIAVPTFNVIEKGATVADDKTIYTGTIGLDTQFIGVIPGIEFDITSMYSDPQMGDKVTIKTTAAQQGIAPINITSYYVSYKYSKAPQDYVAKIFYEYEDVIAEYGQYEVSASTGIVKNSLSLAAEIAFENGISPIVCAQVTSDSDSAYKVAIDSLQRPIPGLKNINTIIPLTSSYMVGSHLKDHVLLMSDPENGKERMAYLSASIGQPISKTATTQDPLMGMIETAKKFNEERIVYVTPGEIIREVTDLNTGKIYDALLPACFAAVAVASISLANDPAEPLTNKPLFGFKSLSQSLLESEKKQLSAAGCLVIEQDNSVIKIRHGITTATFDPTIPQVIGVDNSAAVEQMEITLIQIKDYVSDLARVATAKYIGTKNKATSVADVQQTITTLLNQLIAKEIIIGVEDLVVRRSKNDPREIEVSFNIEAVYPLNYITISFGFAV